jgi:hypothetical protein
VYRDRSVTGDSANMYHVDIEHTDGHMERDHSHADMYTAMLESLALADALGRAGSPARSVVIHHRDEPTVVIMVIHGGLVHRL